MSIEKLGSEITNYTYSTHQSLSIFAQKFLRKCEDIRYILKNKYLCIYEDSFGAKIFRDDCATSVKKSFILMFCKSKIYLFIFLFQHSYIESNSESISSRLCSELKASFTHPKRCYIF